MWVKTKAGKRMPLDQKVIVVVTDQGDVVRGRVSHFTTCPQADAWRGR